MNRNLTVDYLRGLSIFVMIWVHTNAYFLSVKPAFFLWDFFEWAVPVFIFCSAYLFFTKPFELTTHTLLQFLKKRVVRLLIPYYFFVLGYIAIIYSIEPKAVTPSFIFQNITLSGGADINWLVILFMIFSLVIPLIHHWHTKRSPLLWVFMIASFGSSFFFLSHALPLHYKLTNWLPWSTMILYTLYVVSFEKKKWFFPITLAATGLLFFIMRQYQIFLDHNLLHYYNKYPPNLYHLSYGFFLTTVLYLIMKAPIWNMQPIKLLLTFFSKNSYSIYFVHFLLIIYLFSVAKLHMTWISFFLYALFGTILLQLGLNLIASRR